MRLIILADSVFSSLLVAGLSYTPSPQKYTINSAAYKLVLVHRKYSIMYYVVILGF